MDTLKEKQIKAIENAEEPCLVVLDDVAKLKLIGSKELLHALILELEEHGYISITRK